MAITPIRPITSASATATNGSAVITVTGSVDCSFVYSGTVVLLGTRKPVEAVSGTIPDGSGNSTITLRTAWNQPTTTDTLFAFNSIEGLGEAIRRARETVQNISAIEALTANGLIERTGAGVYASVPVSAFAKTILDDADAAALRATIAAQQLDATLTAIAGLTTAANKLPYFTGTDAAALADITAFGRSLIAAADSAAVKTILGLNVTTADIQATVFSDFRRNIHQLYEPFGLTTKAITDIWTTTRAGAATYNSPIGLKSASANTPRIEYNPTTGEARGLLCEAQSTNLFNYSQDFAEETSNWIDARLTVTPASGIAPDGTNTASLITELADVGASYLYRANLTFTAGITYTVSFYAKAYDDGLGLLQLTLPVANGFSSNTTFSFNLVTGVITGSFSGYTPKMTKDINGWWRCSLTALCQTTTTANYIAMNIAAAIPNVVTNQILLWGAQLEAAFGPTSYIPTLTSAAETRVAAQYFRDIDSLVNKSGSTFIIDARTDGGFNSNVNGFFGIGTGFSTNALTLSYSMGSATQLIRARWYIDGVSTEVLPPLMSAPVGQINRVVLTFNENGTFALAVNGTDYGSNSVASPNTAAWAAYWLGSLRTKVDTLIQQATISQFRIIPRYISSATERAELSRQ